MTNKRRTLADAVGVGNGEEDLLCGHLVVSMGRRLTAG